MKRKQSISGCSQAKFMFLYLLLGSEQLIEQ